MHAGPDCPLQFPVLDEPLRHADVDEIYRANIEPLRHADVDEIYRANIKRLISRGSFTAPARTFPGARCVAPAEDPAEVEWEQLRDLWPPDE